MKHILETERLILREFNSSDHDFIIELLNTEGWIKYIGDRNIKTKQQAIQYLENGPMKSYEVNGFGLSLVALKQTLEPIGMCGLIKRADLADIDIGFAFLPAYTNQGYAYEITAATLQYGFEKLNLHRIVAITLPANSNSIKLLQKAGLKKEKEIEKDNEALLLFGIDKAGV